MNEVIRIPEERLSVLIGKDGATKERIEKKCKVRLEISPEGIDIIGEPQDAFFATDVVKAIGRGFEPRKALKLLKDHALYIISLRELLPTEKAITRIKARIIGENGKIKLAIEDSAECFISVYGHTVSIIARVDTMEYAKEAISKIIDGAPHSTVLNYLKKAKRQIYEEKFKYERI